MTMTTVTQWLAPVVLVLATLVLTLVAGCIVYLIWQGRGPSIIGVILETGDDGRPGKPSLARLQMLIWNFIVAFGFLYALATHPDEPGDAIKSVLQQNVLILLGISNGTYYFSKRSTTPATAGGNTGG